MLPEGSIIGSFPVLAFPKCCPYLVATSRSSVPLRRLDQLLSACGYCSRSEAKAWVRAGRITAGGEVVRRSDDKVAAPDVLIDGEPVECPDGLLAVFHKPLGCVCSRDEREGQSVFDLLPARWSRRNPPVSSVGRLDRDTTGLLLITDQGDLLHRLTSPRHKVPKTYEVTFDGRPPADWIERFASGELLLEGESEPCLPATLELTGEGKARLELTEGRFHQVRRMFASQGLLVTALHRSRFGEFTLDGLAQGEWRLLPLAEH